MKKTLAILFAVLLTALLFASCQTTPAAEGSGESASASGAKLEKAAVEIALNGDSFTCSSSSVMDKDGSILINSAGTYLISGSLNDGGIIVDCVDAGVTTLVLKGANITHSDGACIDIVKTQTAVITLYEGTENVLTDGAKYVFENPEDTEPDGAVYSKEDLTINGEGTLTVNGNFACGIVSKDGLKIESGNINVKSVHHGIKGKDYLVVNGGTVTVDAERDGIKSTNYKTELVGYVEINGGKLNINSADEAIQAISAVRFNGGEVTVTSTNNGIKCDGSIIFMGGTVTIDVEDNALNGFDITKSENCTVTIGGNPYNG